jgi:hypothetical protein
VIFVKKFDPGTLTVQQVQEVFRYLGVEAEFVLIPNPDNEVWMKIEEEHQERTALLTEARDLLHHVKHNGQDCPGCDLEERIDKALQTDD